MNAFLHDAPHDESARPFCRTSLRLRSVVTALALLAWLPFVAVAESHAADDTDAHQDWTDSRALRRTPEQAWKLNAWAGYEYQGKTDLDAPGDFKYWMVSGGGSLARGLGDRVKLALKADYRAVGYDFGGITGGVDPWETIHVVRLNPLLTYHLNETWSILGGPIAEFTGEEKADFVDSLRGGGVLGFGYTRGGLFLAAGVIALTEIEKDARIQPFLLVNWKLTEGLGIGLKADNSRGGEFRLQYVFQNKLSLAAGIGVRRELFRLNGDNRNVPGPAPNVRENGVGEETSTVARLTVGYRVAEGVLVEAYGGLTADGEFRLENENGIKIASSDYDTAGFGGLNVRLGF